MLRMREHPERDHDRGELREDDGTEDPERSAPVDERGLVQLARERPDERVDEEDAERDLGRRVQQDDARLRC